MIFGQFHLYRWSNLTQTSMEKLQTSIHSLSYWDVIHKHHAIHTAFFIVGFPHDTQQHDTVQAVSALYRHLVCTGGNSSNAPALTLAVLCCSVVKSIFSGFIVVQR